MAIKTYELGSGDHALVIVVDTTADKAWALPSNISVADGKSIEEFVSVEPASSMAYLICENIKTNSTDEGQVSLAGTLSAAVNP